MGNISCYSDYPGDHVHAGNPVMALPGNQRVISQQCRSFAPFSSNMGLNFRYFTSLCHCNILSELPWGEWLTLSFFSVISTAVKELQWKEEGEAKTVLEETGRKKRKIFIAGSARLTALSWRSTFIDQPFFSLPFSLSCFRVRMCHYYMLIEKRRKFMWDHVHTQLIKQCRLFLLAVYRIIMGTNII